MSRIVRYHHYACISGFLVLLFLLYAAAAYAEGGKAIHFKINAGILSEGPAVVRVSEGETVSLIWSADQQVEVHLHGYNMLIRVGPGGPAEMKVQAKATGRFPVSLHDAKGHGHANKPLTYLEVHPK